MLQKTIDNAAARLGPSRFDWWPKWRDRYVAIVACGPSVARLDLSVLRGRMPVLAVKEAAVRLCPWADAVYGCDLPWWMFRRGLPEFKGLKLGWHSGIVDRFPDVKRLTIRRVPNTRHEKYVDDLLLDEPGEVGGGGNSGFQAVNFAAQTAPRGILLIGFDMTPGVTKHFYGRNDWPKSKNPDAKCFEERWLPAFAASVAVFRALGIEVLNASPVSAIEDFRKVTVEQALQEWGL